MQVSDLWWAIEVKISATRGLRELGCIKSSRMRSENEFSWSLVRSITLSRVGKSLQKETLSPSILSISPYFACHNEQHIKTLVIFTPGWRLSKLDSKFCAIVVLPGGVNNNELYVTLKTIVYLLSRHTVHFFLFMYNTNK